jgi:hypothetical protein
VHLSLQPAEFIVPVVLQYCAGTHRWLIVPEMLGESDCLEDSLLVWLACLGYALLMSCTRARRWRSRPLLAGWQPLDNTGMPRFPETSKSASA